MSQDILMANKINCIVDENGGKMSLDHIVRADLMTTMVHGYVNG